MNYIQRLTTHKRELLFLLLIFCVFLTLRIPGVSLPYHQDEFKTALSVEQGSEASGSMFAHPPLTQIIYRISYFLLGGEHLRWYPIMFSTLSFFLLYFLLRKRSGRRVALIAVTLFSVCFYSVWASLMLDTDGAIIPFFSLCVLTTYNELTLSKSRKKRHMWGILLILSFLLGILVKLSFVLCIGAVVTDFVWMRKRYFSKKDIVYGFIFLLGFILLSVGSLYLVHVLYPAFSIGAMITHAKSFIHIADRDVVQIIVQAVKALFYLSPLLILPLLFASKRSILHTRIQWIFLAYSFFFYFILFDFSRGALDKYLMCLIVPLVVIVATILGEVYEHEKMHMSVLIKNKRTIIISFCIILELILLNFLPHTILPLYPKTAWFTQVIQLKWTFLNPFIGGSGPLGFYVSFLFIGLSFVLSLVFAFLFLVKKQWKIGCVSMLIVLSGVYNAIFAEELLFGLINGNSGNVLTSTLAYIQSHEEIKSVITYNDAGSYELTRMGKYAGRFYAVPSFELDHRIKFREHIEKNGGYFLVTDIPHIGLEQFHGTFFAQCDTIYKSTSGRITSTVYKCYNHE